MALSDLVPSLRAALLPALFLSAAAFVAPAAAQTAAAPASETRSTHDDWTVRCKGAGDKRECEAVQTLQPADGKGILAHVAVRAEKGGLVRLITQVPPGVWLPAHVTLKVAGVPDVVLTYKRCGQYCIASTELKAEEITALKASAGVGDLMFEDGSRHPIILPLSFKGLGVALEASLKG
ncbi:invasion associated locus B family protein [Xanthobacter dioxanivorans]|uniref:Invasion associated locus B family protein n=1 Tax=Xanthobacter dioxanivorans TaxID=2528964 RepID=A0A974SIK2_9HYPH|nr:invasion associated locus B family protein [Xanthobacter dioxanivorans]QRG05438.1 invasion associated locus B family protein [Xanthobacter dioxanivorans]